MGTKIVTIVGARPQFIKAAAVSRVLRKNTNFKEILLHTGQHYDNLMSEIFFEELELSQPDYNLKIGSGFHGKQTGEMLAGIEEILLKEKPDRVLVYGDTNSTLAGALAAVKLHIPIAHVEAGLRLSDPHVPEEINRIVTDQLSDILFAPTVTAVENLVREGISTLRIHQVGDVMYDVALYYSKKADQSSKILQTLKLEQKQYLLATIHRPENTDDRVRLQTIMSALCLIAEHMPVIFPLHPRTHKMLLTYNLLNNLPQGLQLISPIGFLDMLMLEKNASVITTDSGGVQKEAFFHQVPCVILYDKTVWTELVDLGWNFVVPPIEPDQIYSVVMRAVNTRGDTKSKPYGDGYASEKIVKLFDY